jgi:hypothetical protein
MYTCVNDCNGNPFCSAKQLNIRFINWLHLSNLIQKDCNEKRVPVGNAPSTL